MRLLVPLSQPVPWSAPLPARDCAAASPHLPARPPACPPAPALLCAYLQLTRLSALASLSLHGRWGSLALAGCATLGRLTSLWRLELASYQDTPAELLDSLAALRQLEHLHLEALGRDAYSNGPWYSREEGRSAQDQQEAEAEAMAAAAAVAQLTALTELVLIRVGPLLPPPTALAQLPRLQRLQAWHECGPLEGAEGGSQQRRAPALPHGPWQRGMRRLSVDWSLLQRSGVAFLAGLPQLEELYIHEGGPKGVTIKDGYIVEWPSMGDLGHGGVASSAWLWEWLEQHAPLQLVTLEALPSEHAQLGPRLARLAQRRPGLAVECYSPTRARRALQDEQVLWYEAEEEEHDEEGLWSSSGSDSEEGEGDEFEEWEGEGEGEEFVPSSDDDEDGEWGDGGSDSGADA